MSEPSAELTLKLTQWNGVKAELTRVSAPLVAQEMKLRKEVFELAFPEPKEGTNTLALPADWKLKGTYKLDRKIDAAVLPIVLQKLREQNVVADSLVATRHELIAKAYKTLSEENRAIFDQCLTTKPQSPTLELISPTEKEAT